MAKVSEAAACHAATELRCIADRLNMVSDEIMVKKACTCRQLGALRDDEQALSDCYDTLYRARHVAGLEA